MTFELNRARMTAFVTGTIGLLLAGPAAAQSAAPQSEARVTKITYTPSRSIAEIVGAVSLQGPPDVNQQPSCGQLGVPCLTSGRTVAGGLGATVAMFPNATLGVVGEFSAYET